jgi:hypothetical protein
LSRTAESSKIYKTASTTKGIRLKIANAQYSDETVIFENPNAKSSFDDYDSQKMFSTDAGNIQMNTYSSEAIALAANGIDKILANDSLVLDFKTQQTGTYSLTMDMVGDFASKNLEVYLENTITQEEQLLEATKAIELNFIELPLQGQYVLHFRKSTIDSTAVEGSLRAYSADKTIYIENSEQKANLVEIYDLSGKLIISKSISSTFEVIQLSKTGVYLVRLKNNDVILSSSKLNIE